MSWLLKLLEPQLKDKQWEWLCKYYGHRYIYHKFPLLYERYTEFACVRCGVNEKMYYKEK